MLWLQLLPLVLVAANVNVVYATTSPNDPLRALVLQVPKKQGLPVCCLKPLEPIEDEILLSFEEWKQQQGDVINRTADANDSDTPAPVHANDAPAPHSEELQKPPPHFRVPITDRFNYASMECSARVHLSHRGAKSTSSILSSKRDRYMLSPCAAKNQFVVVELCEDIRIDTIQLANFEFFSGIFKDFKLSVAKTDITAEGAFTDAGVFRAKNVRGVQSFHPPTSLRDFYRYIRIDFLSHYGNEYFCPVSLLRVYGLTHLEQWKWDTWEQESKEKAEIPKIEATVQEESTATAQAEVVMENVTSITSSSVSDVPQETITIEGSLIASDAVELTPVETLPVATSDIVQHSQPTPIPPLSAPYMTSESAVATSSQAPPPIDASSTSQQPASSTPLPIVSQKPPHPDATPISSSTKTISASTSTPKAANTSSSIRPASTPPTTPPHAPPSSGPGGESIYRTIMNRLTALEANHTLYARYVEQQTSSVREVLRRIGEDVGRLEGLVRAEGHSNQRALKAADVRTQMELGELIRRIDILADEIVLEKRLGVAQLYVNVLFPSKESGRSTEQCPSTHPKSAAVISPAMRSISSDSRATRPRSRTPSMRSRQHQQQHLHSHSQHYHSSPRPTVPSTPTRLYRPMPLQRSNSHTNAQTGGTPVAHRSARRWARTAHLHEVRGVQPTRGPAVVGNENVNGENPFWDEPEKEQSSRKVQKKKRPVSFDADGDAWVDTDTDIEA
ncbi:hypothetical protein H0H87_006673 [Tephrocybe sp. NHM501043]|nr:hypothetical protein H0H87_006673 [Tephrocybe sp. NHM501043]